MQLLESVTGITFKNILFLTDFTEASEAARAYAVGLSRHYDAQLFPAYACNPIVLTESMAATSVLQEHEENSRMELEKLAKNTGPKSIPLFVRGAVEDAVPHWVNEHQIDLIVMGTHGHKGLKHFLMGSTAEQIIRCATVPVLTVGPHVIGKPFADFQITNILCPTDLNDHASFTAGCALSLAEANSATLTFIHIVPPETLLRGDQYNLLKSARQNLEKLALAGNGIKPRAVVEAGDPVKDIVSFASANKSDLILLGLPASKKFNGHFRTGVTYNVISAAPCPVLTFRDTTDSK